MIPNDPAARPTGWLAKIGLHRPELRAWAMYDWAVSSVQTTIMVAVFPIFFKSVAASGVPDAQSTQYIATANSIAMALIAVLSPILGAIADASGAHKRFLAGFMAIGVAAVSSMFLISRGDLWLAYWLFVIVLSASAATMVFYESLLPHIARDGEIDRVSTAGYAFGYLGGGLLLALNLAWILAPGAFGLPSGENLTPAEASLPARLAFLSVAVWWLLFSIPLFRRVRGPGRRVEPDESPTASPVRTAFSRLGETLREMRGYRQTFLMLLAFLIYNDGIQTIIKMASSFGTDMGFSSTTLIGSILVVQFVGIPFAFLFGGLAGRLGTKGGIFLGLAAYVVICILGYRMTTERGFLVLAGMVGMVQGGTQALSRSLFASMVPRHKSGEFFGFFSIFEKFAGIFGQLLFAVTIAITGNSRNAILGVIGFFVVGGAVLALVDVDEGRRVAREAEEKTREVEGASAA